MKKLFVFSFLILSFLKSNAQISKINLSGKLNLESSFFSGFQKGKTKATLVCFLDSSKSEFKAVENSIRMKLPYFSKDVNFLILTFSPDLNRNDVVSIGDYQILEPQFYILSDLCSMLDSTYDGFDWRYSDLPSALKKIDTKQCFRDKRTETLLSEVVWNALGNFMAFYKANEYVVKLKSNNDREFENQHKYFVELVRNLNIDSLSNQVSIFQKDLSHIKAQSELNVKIKTKGLPYYFSFNSVFRFSNDEFSKNLNRIVLGRNLDVFNWKMADLSLNMGIQLSNDFWVKENVEGSTTHLSYSNQLIEELVVTNSQIRENYSLKTQSVILGLDFKRFIPNRRLYWGLHGNLSFPFLDRFDFENAGGNFDYVGLSSSIQEPLSNIQDLGLVSNVSYVGYKGELEGKVKPFGDMGLLLGWSRGEGATLDFNLSIGYITSKKFDLDKTSSVISSSYGDYNSLLTVNNSQVTIPGYLNFGFGIRKYLN
jgi:hypothetical protein